MGWRIVKNPKTEKFQIFSSVVDAFILDEEISRRALGRFWKDQFGVQGESNFNKILAELDGGPKFYPYEFSYERAKMWHDHQTGNHDYEKHHETCGICKDIKSDEEREKKK